MDTLEDSFWLICPNWVEVQRFSKSINNKNDLYEYIFIEQGIVMGNYGEKPPLMKTQKKMRIEDARIYWQKLITEGWQPTNPKW